MKIKFNLENFEENIVVESDLKKISEATFLLIPEDYLIEKKSGFLVINPETGQKIPVFFSRKVSQPEISTATFLANDNVRLDKETVERDAVYGIIRNPKNNKFLGLEWKKFGWQAFPAGGIEKGEKLEEAARREMLEETGYRNLKFVEADEDKIYENFYRPHKNTNVFVNWRAVFFDLIDEEQEEVSEKETKKHETVWIEKGKMKDFLNVKGVELIWERYLKREEKENKNIFDIWNKIKQKVNKRKHILPNKREIWWIKMGQNIGFEQNGKGDEFLRPVLVLRVFNRKMFFGIPMTSSKKNEKSPYYFSTMFRGEKYFFLLVQARMFSTRRLQQVIRKIDNTEFQKIKKSLRKILRI